MYIQTKFFEHYQRSFYYVFLSITSVGYGDGVSMPTGLTNPSSYLDPSNNLMDYDAISDGWGSDRYKLTFSLLISIISFNFLMGRISSNLDILNKDAETPESK